MDPGAFGPETTEQPRLGTHPTGFAQGAHPTATSASVPPIHREQRAWHPPRRSGSLSTDTRLHRMFRDRPFAWLTTLVVAITAPEALAAAPAAAPTPIAGSSVEAEDVRIETKDGLKLGAAYYAAQKSNGRAPAVLLAHAPGSERTSVEPLARTLSKRGFAVLSLDLRGHGASAAGEAWEELDRAGRERLWTYAQRDLNAAAGYLRGRRDVHTTNLTVVGVGSGCSLALRHASEDENARAVVLLAPSEDQLGFNLVDEVQRCGGLPTMVISPRDGRARAKRLVEGLQSDGFLEIELTVLRTGEAEYLTDKKMPDKVVSYLRDTVVEAKGR